MFHEHRVEITSLVSSTKCNGLEIIFESALKRGRAEVAKRGSLALWNGEPSRLYVRKAQYHWGWDWGIPYFVFAKGRTCNDVGWSLETDPFGNLPLEDWGSNGPN